MAFTPNTPAAGTPLESKIIRDNFMALARANDFNTYVTGVADTVAVDVGTIVVRQDTTVKTGPAPQIVTVPANGSAGDKVSLVYIDQAGVAYASALSGVITWSNPSTFPAFDNPQLTGGAWNYSTNIPVAWVKRVQGQPIVLEADVLDTRPFLQTLKTLVDLEDVSQGEAEAFNDPNGINSGDGQSPDENNIFVTANEGQADAIHNPNALTRNTPDQDNVFLTANNDELEAFNSPAAYTSRLNGGMPTPTSSTPFVTMTDAFMRAIGNPSVPRGIPNSVNPFLTKSDIGSGNSVVVGYNQSYGSSLLPNVTSDINTVNLTLPSGIWSVFAIANLIEHEGVLASLVVNINGSEPPSLDYTGVAYGTCVGYTVSDVNGSSTIPVTLKASSTQNIDLSGSWLAAVAIRQTLSTPYTLRIRVNGESGLATNGWIIRRDDSNYHSIEVEMLNNGVLDTSFNGNVIISLNRGDFSAPFTGTVGGPQDKVITLASGTFTLTGPLDGIKSVDETLNILVTGYESTREAAGSSQGSFLPPIPVITSGTMPAGQENIAYAGYNITATNMSPSYGPPLTYLASGLPSGLSCNSSTGLISGTPSAGTAGVYSVTITAINSGGSDSDVVSLTIIP